MPRGSEQYTMESREAAIARQRQLISEYRSLREEYLGRYKEVVDEKQRTTMEAESCVSIAHEAHRIMRRLEKQLQLLLDPPLLQPLGLPATDVPSCSSRAAALPLGTQQLPAASKLAGASGHAIGAARARPCLQAESAAMPASGNGVPARKQGRQQPSHTGQQSPCAFTQQQPAQPAARISTGSPSFIALPVDYHTQLQQELQKRGRLCGASCRSTSHTSSSRGKSNPARTSNDSCIPDQHTTQPSWGATHMEYQQVQPDGTLDGAIAALDAMLTDPTLNSLVAKYAPHASCLTAWQAAAAAPIPDWTMLDAATTQCLQDSMMPAEPPSPGQPSGAAPLVASIAAAAGRHRLLQEQRKRQELHSAEWQCMQQTAAAQLVNKLCRTAGQRQASLRIRMRRFLHPSSLQAQADREELQLATQAMRNAPCLQPKRRQTLVWLEKRRHRLRRSWQHKHEQLGGRAAVWMVCTLEPRLAQMRGRAGAVLAAVQKALLAVARPTGAVAAADTTPAAPAPAVAAVKAAAPAPTAAAPSDIESGQTDAVLVPQSKPAQHRLLHLWAATSKAAVAAMDTISVVRTSIAEKKEINTAVMLEAANKRVEAAHKSSEAAAAAAALKGSTAARTLLITLLPFMMNAAEQEQRNKEQAEVKNRRRLSPQDGYSWDVYPTLEVVLEEQREFKSAAAAPDADVFQASMLGAGDLQERQQQRTAAAARSAAVAAEARAMQGMQAALQHQQQWQLWAMEWQLRLQLAASYLPVVGPLVSSSSSEAAAQLAAITRTKAAIQRTKQADKAAASLASQLNLTKGVDANKHAPQLYAAGAAAVAADASLEAPPPNSISAYYSTPPQPAPLLPARTELLQWKQQLRQVRAWHMRCWTRSITRAALHAARGRDMQVGGGRGYEIDEEFEEWEDNLPFELARLQQHPQLIEHLIKEHQAAHERGLVQFEPATVQPFNSSSRASWLRKHDTSRSIVAWLGSGIGSLMSSSSSCSNSGDGEGSGSCSLEEAAVFAEAPVWETSMDCMTKELADIAAVVLQAEGRFEPGGAVWPPAMYDNKDSGCCRQGSSVAGGTAQQPQVPAAVRWQSPIVEQQLQRAPVSVLQMQQQPAAAAKVALVSASAAGAAGAASAASVSKQSKRLSPRPASPAAENNSSRHSSNTAGSSIKLPASMAHLHQQGKQLPGASRKQATSSSTAGSGSGSSSSVSTSASKLMSHHKHSMSAIQEEDRFTGLAAAAAAAPARLAKQQQQLHLGQCEIEVADSDDDEQQVDCSAASDASMHFKHSMLA